LAIWSIVLKGTDFVTALGQLLSQPELQQLFIQAPEEVADRLNLAADHRALFVALDPEQVIAQANLLITKRLKEVRAYLSQTFILLGHEGATCFKSYATIHWPRSHRRHQEDACQFCDYLKNRNFPVNQSEVNYLRFLTSGRRVGLALAKDALIQTHLFPAIQVFYRYKGTMGQWRLYLKG
jgi:hypothetical protein